MGFSEFLSFIVVFWMRKINERFNTSLDRQQSSFYDQIRFPVDQNSLPRSQQNLKQDLIQRVQLSVISAGFIYSSHIQLLPITLEKMSNKSLKLSFSELRRKTSLNALDCSFQRNSPDISMLKFKNQQKIQEVDQLSFQLENLARRRSLTSRSFCEGSSNLTSRSIDGNKEEPETKKAPPQFFTGKTSQPTEPIKPAPQIQSRPKTPLIFNNFDVIEEDSYLNEEQVSQAIEPVTFKNNPLDMPGTPRKQQKQKQERSKMAYQIDGPKGKIINSSKAEGFAAGKRDNKHKIDMKQLDKMHKELEGKKMLKQAPMPATERIKTSLKINSVKDVKEPKPVFPQKAKIPLTNNVKPSRPISKSGSQSIIPCSTKLKELKQLKEPSPLSPICVSSPIESPVVMKATRMLSSKEKEYLLSKLASMQQMINNNEICVYDFEGIEKMVDGLEEMLRQ